MRGSAAFRAAIAPGGILAGPWVKNPLWRTALAVPSLDLQFADNKSLADAVTGQSLVTFTRASSGTYVDSTGTLRTAAVNEPRFDHNPTTGESLGLLVEEQRTNLLLQSNGFDATWINSLTTETANAGTAPDGTNTAWELKDTVDATASLHLLSQTPASFVSGTTYSYSIWAKSGTLTHIALTFPSSAFASTLTTRYSLQTGTAVAVAPGTTATVTAFPDGWYRVTTTATATASASGTLNIRLAQAGTTSYQGDGTGTILIWGAQLEAGAFPTSYIPTTTATATRSADVASITGTNFSSWYRQDEGTVFASTSVLAIAPATSLQTQYAIHDGSTDNRLTIYKRANADTSTRLDIAAATVSSAFINAGTFGLNNLTASAIRANDFAVSSNGLSAVVDTSGNVPSVNQITLGSYVSATGFVNGTIRRFTYFPQRLPNSTLQQITS